MMNSAYRSEFVDQRNDSGETIEQSLRNWLAEDPWSVWEPFPVTDDGRILFSVDVGVAEPLFSDAGAFVVRGRPGSAYSDTLVVSFEGSGALGNTADWDDWVSTIGGGISWDPLYAQFSEFRSHVQTLANDGSRPISKIIVTGHSQGAAMVEKFMEEFGSDQRFVAVTFASPGTDALFDLISGSRFLKIEHSHDVVVDLADKAGPLEAALLLAVAPFGSWAAVAAIVSARNFNDTEADLSVQRPEADGLGIVEHYRQLYLDTAMRLFDVGFAEDVLRNFATINPLLLSNDVSSLSPEVTQGSLGNDWIFWRWQKRTDRRIGIQ